MDELYDLPVATELKREHYTNLGIYPLTSVVVVPVIQPTIENDENNETHSFTALSLNDQQIIQSRIDELLSSRSVVMRDHRDVYPIKMCCCLSLLLLFTFSYYMISHVESKSQS